MAEWKTTAREARCVTSSEGVGVAQRRFTSGLGHAVELYATPGQPVMIGVFYAFGHVSTRMISVPSHVYDAVHGLPCRCTRVHWAHMDVSTTAFVVAQYSAYYALYVVRKRRLLAHLERTGQLPTTPEQPPDKGGVITRVSIHLRVTNPNPRSAEAGRSADTSVRTGDIHMSVPE